MDLTATSEELFRRCYALGDGFVVQVAGVSTWGVPAGNADQLRDAQTGAPVILQQDAVQVAAGRFATPPSPGDPMTLTALGGAPQVRTVEYAVKVDDGYDLLIFHV